MAMEMKKEDLNYDFSFWESEDSLLNYGGKKKKKKVQPEKLIVVILLPI